MKLFTRIAATLNASTESAVTRFENHDAIAERALKGIRQNVAEARVRHQRVVRDGERIRQNIQTLEQQITQWSDRARGTAANDEERAMACLQRRASCRKQLARAEEILREHTTLEARTGSQLEQMQRRLEQATLQRNHLRSRESIARAGQSLSVVDGNTISAIDDVFQRWETVIGESEVHDTVNDSITDSLAREFETAEAQARMRKELDDMLEGDVDDE